MMAADCLIVLSAVLGNVCGMTLTITNSNILEQFWTTVNFLSADYRPCN